MPSRDNRTGRLVLVSGAGSGIGEALARRFAFDGNVVIGYGRNAARLKALEKSITRLGGIFVPVQCDVRNETSVRGAGKKVARLGKVDVLVNNAGVTYFKDFISTTTKEFDRVMETNVRGMFLLTAGILPSMIKRRRGLIINILSYAAKAVYTGSSVYAASKSAGAAMMSVLREEVRDKGVKVLNIYPGAAMTPMWSAKNRSRFRHRMMRPEDVAEFVVATSRMPASMMVEEIAFRPQQGDLRI